MLTTNASQLSNEDALLIETHQLGTLLNVYRLKPSYIRLLRWTGLSIFLFGLITLAFIIFTVLYKGADIQSDTIFGLLLGGLYALFHGGVFYRIMLQRARSARVIVCEHGLLQIKKKIKSNYVEVVLWKDILTAKKALVGQEYIVVYRGDKLFPQLTLLSSSYQNLNELVALITAHSEQLSLT